MFRLILAIAAIAIAILAVACTQEVERDDERLGAGLSYSSERDSESSVQPGSLQRSDITVACSMVVLYGNEPSPIVYAFDSEGTFYPLNGNAKDAIPLADVPIRDAEWLVAGSAADKQQKIQTMIQEGLAACENVPEPSSVQPRKVEPEPPINPIEISRLRLICQDVGPELEKPKANALFAMDNVTGALYPLNATARQWFSLPQWRGVDDIQDISAVRRRGSNSEFRQAVINLANEAFSKCW